MNNKGSTVMTNGSLLCSWQQNLKVMKAQRNAQKLINILLPTYKPTLVKLIVNTYYY